MPRRIRNATGGIAYHVLNRAAGGATIFHDDADYLAFERIIERTHERLAIRILSYCLLSTHWHFVLWPEEDGQLSEFMRLLSVTHTQRHHAHYHTAGTGPVYQGRFKSFPIEQDAHLLNVCRYVERNAVRAKLVKRAQAWPWCSLAVRQGRKPPGWLLPARQWPVRAPRDWAKWVNQAQTPKELEALNQSVKRGKPYGDVDFQTTTARQLGLESTLRPRGRQRVNAIKDSRPL